MPVLRDMAERPDWCELEAFGIHHLGSSGELDWPADHPANKLVVVEGLCVALVGDEEHPLAAGDVLDAGQGHHRVFSTDGAEVVVLGGHWGDDCGGSGVFDVAEEVDPRDGGDSVTYEKRVSFDRHYHDCDEYWIIVRGRGTAVSEEIHHPVGPGACVATRMGDHHDFPLVDEPVRAVYFETTMMGLRRRGHLWEHTHGPATPVSDGPARAS